MAVDQEKAWLGLVVRLELCGGTSPTKEFVINKDYFIQSGMLVQDSKLLLSLSLW
jgi:hypothetical protein